MTFTHLYLHNEYSFLDGVGSSAQYISKVKALKMTAAAITNHGNVTGCIEWQKECDKRGISPILGCEAYIVKDARIKKQGEKRGHIVLLVKNHQGWIDLCRILTHAHLEGFYNRPRIDFGDLLNTDLSNFVILTGCIASFVNLPGGMEALTILQKRVPDSLYLEIMPHDYPPQYEHNKKMLEMHNEFGIPLIATNDCHYIEEEDWETQEVLLAIQRKAKWNDKNRFKFSLKGLHLKTEREMQIGFMKHCFSRDQIKEAIANTAIAAKACCDFRIPKQDISLPNPYEGHKDSDNEILDELCWQKIEKFDLDRHYQNRYRQEYALIKKKDFSRYFLIFYDLVQWCSKNGIPVGPGRGSVAGSLIAFLIGITKIDPIKFHLSFARFISEDRGDWPDIDMDFAKRDREKVREYIRQKYGLNHTCGISTDMRLKNKAAVQAVARVFDTGDKVLVKDAIKFSSLIQKEDNALQNAIDGDGAWFAKKYPRVIHFAKKLENQVRGQSQHPAGQIISEEDLTLGTKCVLIKRKKVLVSCWDMAGCDYSGLMKMDILGLSTLSVLDECERLINLK